MSKICRWLATDGKCLQLSTFEIVLRVNGNKPVDAAIIAILGEIHDASSGIDGYGFVIHASHGLDRFWRYQAGSWRSWNLKDISMRLGPVWLVLWPDNGLFTGEPCIPRGDAPCTIVLGTDQSEFMANQLSGFCSATGVVYQSCAAASRRRWATIFGLARVIYL